MTLPQVWNIWIDHNAAGVSTVSWASYFVFAFIWLVYGIAHKDKPIIVSNTLWIILDIMIVVGTFIYS